MSFGVLPEHIQYFNQNSKIEFEDFLKPGQLKILLATFSKNTPLKPSLEWGFDLWRKEEEIKPIITGVSLARVAGQLKNFRELRFGYSQYLSSNCFSNKTSLLYRKSCIKKLVVGACICLKVAKEPESPFFPEKEGQVLFFDIDDDFYLKFPRTTGQYLFIFFADFKARFFMQEEGNEIEHAFRVMGYENGDFLKEKLNPSYQRIHS